ncbi:heavy-metal-associated domain-containing protein [Empedobacter stercoris]|uniref:heavy-metal-associated domain-containing protein n=1 Tax=Empedobacter stercoris TaxID=1628248 RepID=UPI0039E9067C
MMVNLYYNLTFKNKMIHTIEVENIKCGGCMNSIKTALQQMEGVQEVNIDKDTETVTIESESNKEPFIQKLNDLGYPQKGNNSLLKKAKSYVSCAVGNLKS